MPRVKISCVDGNLSYEPSLFYLDTTKPEEVQWWSEEGHAFAVHIGWDTPLDKGRYRAEAGKNITASLREDAASGEYKYFVAVFDGKKVWTDDPYFIVKP